MEHNEPILPLLTIGDLWQVFRRHVLAIALAAALAAAGLFAANRILPPKYQSTATLYILGQSGESPSSEDFSLALKVVDDCAYLLKSRSVLDSVISYLKLDMTCQELADTISTANPEDTRILEVTAISTSPYRAKQIVDAVCDAGMEKIGQTLGTARVTLYESGTLTGEPCNRSGLPAYLLVSAAGGLLVYGWFLLRFLVDDQLHSAKYLMHKGTRQKQKTG